MLTTLPSVQHPFRGEGNDFWGNQPPFTPVGSPAGDIYAGHGGLLGHTAGEADATPAVKALLLQRLDAFDLDDRPVINKNPFNSVRIPWLKALFPNAVIVAIYRNPAANIYSLSKKFVAHEKRGRGPEAGWWGVKPARWESMVSNNIALQLCRQWNGVNQSIMEQRHNVRLLIRYDEFCAAPRQVIKRILSLAHGFGVPEESVVPEHFTCLDEEYRTGSRLLSRNRDFVKTGSFTVEAADATEHQPFSDKEVSLIGDQTTAVAHALDSVRDHVR